MIGGPIMGGLVPLKFTSAGTNVLFDGNSIVDPAYSDLATQLQALAPISGQLTITNTGVSGQNITNMITRAPSFVDAAYVPGKKNVLIVFEITNTIFNQGKTGLQACTDMTTYLQGRLTANPGWIVVLLTTLPRGSLLGSYTAAAGEAEVQAANTYMRQNFRSMGARALVEVRRAGGPFDFTDTANMANFPASLWTDPTHPSNGVGGGKSILAGYIADVLKRLPAR